MNKRLTLLTILVVTFFLAVTAPFASAATTKKTVPATVVIEHKSKPGVPGSCSSLVFVQWTDVKGTISATANFTYNGKLSHQTGEPPFDDSDNWVALYTVPPGQHWLELSKSWRNGHAPSDCSDFAVKQRQVYDTAATVDLTIKAGPAITSKPAVRGRVGTKLSYQIESSPKATKFYLSGTLPAGLTIDKKKGKISGKPTKAGTKVVTIKTNTSAGLTPSTPLTLIIVPK